MKKAFSLADQVFERLENDILLEVYPRGSVQTEDQLCRALGVTPVPVCEAIIRLEQEHLVERTADGILILSLTDEDAAAIYEIRSRIEGLAAAACAAHITDAQLRELEEVVQLQEQCLRSGDTEQIKAADSRFHQLIYRGAASPVYFDTLAPLHRKIQKYRKKSVENYSRAQASTAEHRRVYEALAARDCTLAQQVMQEHIAKAAAHVAQLRKEHREHDND